MRLRYAPIDLPLMIVAVVCLVPLFWHLIEIVIQLIQDLWTVA